MPFDCAREELIDHFTGIAEVSDVYMPTLPDGRPRGFAFVTINEEALDECLSEINGSTLMGRKLVVSVPLAPGEKSPRRGTCDDDDFCSSSAIEM